MLREAWTAGNANDQATIQSYLDEGGEIRLCGHDVTLVRPLIIRRENTMLAGKTRLSATFNGPLVRVVNADYVRTDLLMDGGWAATGVQILGGRFGEHRLDADRMRLGFDLDCGPGSGANRQASLNRLSLHVRNGYAGLRLRGQRGQEACDNTIERLQWWGHRSIASTGIEVVQYADNNIVQDCYLRLNSPGSVGIALNTGAPGSDVEIYENHFNGIIESDVAGTIAVRGRRTMGSKGEWPTRMQIRLSGKNNPKFDVSGDCDLDFTGTNYNPGLRSR